MRKLKIYYAFLVLILFLTGTVITMAQPQYNRFGFLDEFDDDVISSVWQDYDSKYNLVEENGRMKCTVNMAANEWKSLGLELPVPIDVTGAKLQVRIKASRNFPFMVKAEDKNGVADNWPHPTFSVTQSDYFKLYTFDFSANYGAEDSYDATQVSKIYFFFGPQASFNGTVEFEYLAIGKFTKDVDKPYTGFYDDFEHGLLIPDEPWSDYGETNYALTMEEGVLKVACNSGAWTGWGLKFDDRPLDLSANPVIKIRMKSDQAFPFQVKFKDAAGVWDAWPHPTFNVEATNYFKLYTFEITGFEGNLSIVEEISFSFNPSVAFVCNVEIDFFSVGSYNNDAVATMTGFFDDFATGILVPDQPWSNYDESNYTLTATEGTLKIACTSSAWTGWGLKFYDRPLDLSANPVIKLRMRSDKPFPFQVKFKDATGTWDAWPHPTFNVQATDYFKVYTFDISAFDGNLSIVEEISFSFNPSQAFTCNVEFDWFSVGSTNPVDNRLRTLAGQNYFVNGINLTWLNYGGVELTGFEAYEPQYIAALDEIALSGGNAIRWWLHTNAVHTPIFGDDGKVLGVGQETLDAIKRALDLAGERNIRVELTLWTHNLLRSNAGETNYQRNYNLITSTEHTNAYIENALIPIVEHVKGHPAIQCWDIVNEPEILKITGFEPTRQEIQKFINLQAGAIRRTDPSAIISVGALNMNAIKASDNWFSDAALVAAGGDPDGILDYFKFHYYGGTNPFQSTPAELALDTSKPIVIGEFSNKNESGGQVTTMTMEELYLAGYAKGYAGVMAWKYFETPGDNTGGFSHHKPGIEAVYKAHTDDVKLWPLMDVSSPFVRKIIPVLMLWPRETAWDTIGFVKLDTIFFDKQDGGDLLYTIDNNTNPEIVTPVINPDYTLDLSFPANAMGEAFITVKAENSAGLSTKTTFRVYIIDTRNKAIARPVKSSSIESEARAAQLALDADPTTRFATALGAEGREDEWFFVDLGADYPIGRLEIDWEAAYGKKYKIYYAPDAASETTWDFLWDQVHASFVEDQWTLAFTESAGTGGTDVIPFGPGEVTARYIGFLGIERFNSEWGYSMWEFKVFVSAAAKPVFSPDPAIVYTEAVGVTISSETEGATVEYRTSTDGGTTWSDWLVYNIPVQVPGESEMKFQARAKKLNWETSDISMATYTVTGKVASPEFSPDPAVNYTEAIDVSITTTTAGAAIKYRTSEDDGENWSEWTEYEGTPFQVGKVMKIEAMATKQNWADSDPTVVTYKIYPTHIEKTTPEGEIRVWTVHDNLYIELPFALSKGSRAHIYSVTGSLLHQADLQPVNKQSISLNLQQGLYILVVTGNEKPLRAQFFR